MGEGDNVMRPNRHAFTLIELLVVISIIAILMAIMMPALQRVKSQAQEIGCRANLRQYGLAQTMYRWHDPRYPADGPFWMYLKEEKAHLCPTFNVVAKTMGEVHPSHVATNPVVPYYSYSMNAFLGSTNGTTPGGVLKRSAITRRNCEVFFFGEENMWARPGNANVLNDNALCGDGRDWFGTFHGAKRNDWNGGTANLVFVDAHVEQVRSGLQETPDDQMDKSTAEYGRFEKFAWPFVKPPT
jgi:prepilin-type N-terminal cleavage/methylation domain-containing protein/prepilin-type processing-associated H-X9-DG protein